MSTKPAEKNRSRRVDEARIEQLNKQLALFGAAATSDRRTIRILAQAGAGGTY